VIRIGYQPIVRDVDLGTSDTTIAIVMRPTVARLAEVRVIASRPTGVFGKVGRASDWSPVPDATVVIFGGRTMRTDSTGSFEAPDLRAGTHLLRVQREGFAPQLRSVTVPPSGAVEVAVLLDSGSTTAGFEGAMAELNQRQRWRGNESAVLPREELMRLGSNPTLTAAMRSAPSFGRKGLVIGDNACVFVNGEPKPGWPIDAYSVDQIEAIEVYAGRSEMSGTLGKRWPRGAPCGTSNPARPAPRRPGTVSFVVIWLKPGVRR
jgi:hypothetical protein